MCLEHELKKRRDSVIVSEFIHSKEFDRNNEPSDKGPKAKKDRPSSPSESGELGSFKIKEAMLIFTVHHTVGAGNRT